MGVPQSYPLYSPVTPLLIYLSPYTTTVPSLVSTNIYFISLTFSLGPDEVATVWWLQKLVCDYNVIYFVSVIKQFTYMDKKKGSNIFKYK